MHFIDSISFCFRDSILFLSVLGTHVAFASCLLKKLDDDDDDMMIMTEPLPIEQHLLCHSTRQEAQSARAWHRGRG